MSARRGHSGPGDAAAAGSALLSAAAGAGAAPPPPPPPPFHGGELLESGVAALSWSADGYQLVCAESRSARRLVEIQLATPCQSCRAAAPQWRGVQALMSADRIFLVDPSAASSHGPEGGLAKRPVPHLLLPPSYVAANWPLRHVALSPDGDYIAGAGARGLVLYGTRRRHWRVFGDISQERALRVQHLLWVSGVVGLCNSRDSGASELLFFPSYHLDRSTMLLRHALPAAPLAMDSAGTLLAVTLPGMDITIYRAEVLGELSRAAQPKLQLLPLRQVCLGLGPLTLPPLVVAMDLCKRAPRGRFSGAGARAAASDGGSAVESATAFASSSSEPEIPGACLALWPSGDLISIDMVSGRQQPLVRERAGDITKSARHAFERSLTGEAQRRHRCCLQRAM